MQIYYKEDLSKNFVALFLLFMNYGRLYWTLCRFRNFLICISHKWNDLLLLLLCTWDERAFNLMYVSVLHSYTYLCFYVVLVFERKLVPLLPLFTPGRTSSPISWFMEDHYTKWYIFWHKLQTYISIFCFIFNFNIILYFLFMFYLMMVMNDGKWKKLFSCPASTLERWTICCFGIKINSNNNEPRFNVVFSEIELLKNKKVTKWKGASQENLQETF